jgi:hypothetical protein
MGAFVPWSPGRTGGVAAARDPGRFADQFLRPGRAVQPKFRWWWPHGLVDPGEIAREIDQIADAGFGGVEIADVHHSITQPLDPAGHGWGTPAWIDAVRTALACAEQKGLTVDVTIGPAWPAAVPTITPDSAAAFKELAHGRATVDGDQTFSGPVPGPIDEPGQGVTEQELVAVQAARVGADSSPDAEPVVLELDSLENLTDLVQDGRLIWTAPAGGVWILVTYWLRGSGQRPERGPHTEPLSYVVDHFSAAGVQAVIDFWESTLLTPAIRTLLRESGGALFEDSIELETDATLWTSAMPAEFERRLGYPIWDVLPAVVQRDEDEVFSFGSDLDRRAVRDFQEVLSQLYIENHVRMLQDWARSVGMQLRIQPAGLRTDAIAKAGVVDIPEGESLGFNNLDDFRCLAGGRDLGGKRILSSEVGAYPGAAYGVTWERILQTLGSEYAAGVNQAVLHGFSYADAPGASWPGFAAFTPFDGRPGFAESWGPRQPTWQHAPDVSAYLARNQMVLQTGTPQVDVAILRQRGFAGTGIGAPGFTAGMGASPTYVGWTHQFISPRQFDLAHATVSGGRLAPDGPAYKALVIEQDIIGRRPTLLVSEAERILEFTRAGLPVVIVAPAPDDVPGIAKPGETERLQEVVGELLAEPSVRLVPDRNLVPDALIELGVGPDVQYSERSQLLSSHRVDRGVDLYYFCSGRHQDAPNRPFDTVDQTVTLRRTHGGAIPYELDAWTGTIARVAVYQEVGDRIRLRVKLKPGETTIIALGRRDWHNDRAGTDLHATSTDADELRSTGERLFVRATRAGTYTTTLAVGGGRDVTTTIEQVPDAQTLSRWSLAVDDWQPGSSPTETVVHQHELTLEGLVPWAEIPELLDVSGLGRYRTTVQLGDPWTGGHGAYLDLGQVFDTYRVTVNGRPLPPGDQLDTVVDVGPHLRVGTNTVEVEVATTLNNRLRVADPEVYGANARQAYGLIGPVRLVPYGEAPVR